MRLPAPASKAMKTSPRHPSTQPTPMAFVVASGSGEQVVPSGIRPRIRRHSRIARMVGDALALEHERTQPQRSLDDTMLDDVKTQMSERSRQLTIDMVIGPYRMQAAILGNEQLYLVTERPTRLRAKHMVPRTHEMILNEAPGR